MNKGLENLLTQINNLESQNRLINIDIEESRVNEKELHKKEKELIAEIEAINRQIEIIDKEEVDLNNDISRVDLICKNVEATLHNEFVKVEMSAKKLNQVEEYLEENDKKINIELKNAEEKIHNCLIKLKDCDNEEESLELIKKNNFLLDQITLEELYEIYETTKEKYQDNTFKNYCDKITIVDYKNHSYFCNPTHLIRMINILSEKIKRSNNEVPFNFSCVAEFFGIEETQKEEERENFGLSELNKIMINHYKSKKINMKNECF